LITDHMKDVISQMNEDFEYTFDKDQFDVPEHYRIPTEPSGEVVKDDCDGYATGLLYRLVDYDREVFWHKLHSDEAAIVKVWAKYRDGSVGGSHAILRWDSDGVSYFADNIYPYWRTDMMHNLSEYPNWQNQYPNSGNYPSYGEPHYTTQGPYDYAGQQQDDKQ